MYQLKSHITINQAGIFVNGDPSQKQDIRPFEQDQVKIWYKNSGIRYSKFYKMDPFCQWGFMAAETLLFGHKKMPAEAVGVFLANQNSSLHTDFLYFDSVLAIDTPASPSLFVYTLPNILIGELCIRHQWNGPNSFWVSNEFPMPLMEAQLDVFFSNPNHRAALVGWVDPFVDQPLIVMAWLVRSRLPTQTTPWKKVFNSAFEINV